MISQVLSGSMTYGPTAWNCQYGSMDHLSSIARGSRPYNNYNQLRLTSIGAGSGVFGVITRDGKRRSESAIRTRSVPKQ